MEFKDPPIDCRCMTARESGSPDSPARWGVTAVQITDPADIGPAIEESTRRNGPTLLDVVVDDGFGNEGR